MAQAGRGMFHRNIYTHVFFSWFHTMYIKKINVTILKVNYIVEENFVPDK